MDFLYGLLAEIAQPSVTLGAVATVATFTLMSVVGNIWTGRRNESQGRFLQ